MKKNMEFVTLCPYINIQTIIMGFDQYHEPPQELPQRVRIFARIIQSLIEEAEAIEWYEQRLAVEKDREAKKIMPQTQQKSLSISPWTLSFY